MPRDRIRLPPSIDGRTIRARRFRQLAANFADETLGPNVTPTPSQESLILQASGLALESERLAAEQIAGQSVNGDIVRTANALTRTLAILQAAKQQRGDSPLTLAAHLAGDADE